MTASTLYRAPTKYSGMEYSYSFWPEYFLRTEDKIAPVDGLGDIHLVILDRMGYYDGPEEATANTGARS